MIVATMVEGFDYREIRIETNGERSSGIPILRWNAEYVKNVYAESEDLEMCCDILGRKSPPKEYYTFFGDNAKEIAANFPSP